MERIANTEAWPDNLISQIMDGYRVPIRDQDLRRVRDLIRPLPETDRAYILSLFNDPIADPSTEDQREGLFYALDILEPDIREIILMYFKDRMTFGEISKKLSVQPDRVRYACIKGVRTLKNSNRRFYILYGLSGGEVMSLEEKKRRIEHLKEKIKKEVLEEKNLLSDENLMHDTYPIESLNLSTRTYNGLYRVGCRNAGDIRRLADNGRLLRVRNLGEGSVTEAAEKINALYGTDYTYEKIKEALNN